jgi:alkanesulfonate monooxygenase SsuD/methylene tetrahydromethanopterin reductase-like flavin-dependent oxidoreductase (luciferase family)
MAFPATRDRMEMLEEACQVLRLMWAQPAADFDGRHYRLEGATCEPKPVQAHLPLLIGGRGERRTLRTVARFADRWNGSGSVEMLCHSADVLRRHCEREGRDPADVALTVMNECHVTADAAEARAHLEHAARFRGLTVDDARDRVWIGSSEAVRAQLAAFAEAGFDEAILGLNPPYGARTFELLEALMG